MYLLPLRSRLTALAAAIGLSIAAPAAAEPLMWVVKDADSTIYLFGTVHALKPGLDWHTRKVSSAMSESSELVLEIAGMEEPGPLQALMKTQGIDTTRTLSSRLTPTDRARLAEAAKLSGLPPQALEPMKPWLAALTLTMAPLIKAGYQADSGVELVLTTHAKALGRPIRGLETMRQQVGFFANLPEAQQVALLSATLESVSEAEVEIDKLVAAWLAGDERALETAVVDEMKKEAPELYDVVFTRRNKAWADQIKTKLDGSGVSFIAVGAGHLVGPDSVIAELKKRGVTAERR